jgi:hypothetical protein
MFLELLRRVCNIDAMKDFESIVLGPANNGYLKASKL